jgi:hypothetical protein
MSLIKAPREADAESNKVSTGWKRAPENTCYSWWENRKAISVISVESCFS